MIAIHTVPLRIICVLALVTAGGLAGCSTAADAAQRPTESCGDAPVRAEWPTELPAGTRLISEARVVYVVQPDCGALTLIRSDDPHSCYYLTAYGLQRYPC
jgi:hypothetical protein